MTVNLVVWFWVYYTATLPIKVSHVGLWEFKTTISTGINGRQCNNGCKYNKQYQWCSTFICEDQLVFCVNYSTFICEDQLVFCVNYSTFICEDQLVFCVKKYILWVWKALIMVPEAWRKYLRWPQNATKVPRSTK